MSSRRLPVAPRPFRDELLSSWLGRVGCRYGLAATELAGAAIDDAAPPQEDIACWARTCGVDPERLSRLALSRRHRARSP
ncbi:MAG: TniQ family protein, partial [Methylocystis sp.]